MAYDYDDYYFEEPENSKEEFVDTDIQIQHNVAAANKRIKLFISELVVANLKEICKSPYPPALKVIQSVTNDSTTHVWFNGDIIVRPNKTHRKVNLTVNRSHLYLYPINKVINLEHLFIAGDFRVDSITIGSDWGYSNIDIELTQVF